MADDFYVGYLPTPPSHAKLLRLAIPAMLWLMLFAALAIGWSQRDPGPAVWKLGEEQSWEGVLRVAPYATIEVETPSGIETSLLVEVGKHGAQQRAEPLHGRRVIVRGWPLEREGRRVIELVPDESAIQPAAGDGATFLAGPAVEEDLGEMAIRGEIVDTKCFYGAMKPGDGKGHKACAILCIRGGIPPTLAARDAAGGHVFYVLRGIGGASGASDVLPLVGDPVEVRGRLFKRNDMLFLEIGPGSIRRL